MFIDFIPMKSCDCINLHRNACSIFLGEMQRIAFRLLLWSCMSVSVCVCVCLCVCRVCGRQENSLRQKRRFFKWRGITPDIICKSLTQIELQIPRWRTK